MHEILNPSDSGNDFHHPSSIDPELLVANSCINNNFTATSVQQQNIQRSDLYLVSKLPSPFHRHVEQAVRKTLNDLRVDYLDLYLGTLYE